MSIVQVSQSNTDKQLFYLNSTDACRGDCVISFTQHQVFLTRTQIWPVSGPHPLHRSPTSVRLAAFLLSREHFKGRTIHRTHKHIHSSDTLGRFSGEVFRNLNRRRKRSSLTPIGRLAQRQVHPSTGLDEGTQSFGMGRGHRNCARVELSWLRSG